jgi:bacillithiol biosynthesis cysteine-adding enzyme BshC
MKLEFDYSLIDPRSGVLLDRLVEHRPSGIATSLRKACLAHGKAAENLDRLFSGNSWCITTGQQPGLGTGPLYTIYKALSAISLAKAAERRLNHSVVPVFWVAGDDHDFAESNHLCLLTPANDLKQVTLRSREADDPSRPMYREPVGDDIAGVLDAVRQMTPDTEYKDGILDWVKRHYAPESDLASAFAGALAELLGERGLVVFQPTHEVVKQASVPLLLQALERAPQLDRRLRDWADQLSSEGHDVPIAVGHGATTAMIEGSLGRDRLVLEGKDYKARRSGERWTFEQLTKIAEREPQRLSANVLLRPVLEATLLPTLAYIGGPGELAYLPQAQPLYEDLQVTPQARIRRWSARVIESRIAKVLNKFGISVDDLAAPPGQLEASLVRDQLPDEVDRVIGSMREVLERDYEQLALAAAGVDPTLQKPVRAARHNALRSLADIEKKLITHLKKQNETAVQQVAKARVNLMPLGKPQERVLNVIQYMMRYGEGFLDEAAQCCERWALPLETGNGDT